MKRVAVVILNWNGKKFLEKFLPGVVKHSSADADIIVADNASEDDSIQFLREHFPQIRIIQNPVNGGFAKGYNDALTLVDSHYYVLLNSDIEVTENWIKPAIAMMDADRRIAACQPKLLGFDQRNHFEYAGAAGGFIDHYGYPFCRGRIFQEIEPDNGQYDQEMEIFWATGACMFVRTEMFHRFSGFDNDFFAHMEEIDLCWRLKNAGLRIMFCPASVVYHVGGGTLPKKSSRKTYLNFRNNLALIFKNIPSGEILGVFLTRWALDWVAAIKFLTEGDISDFWAVLKAQWYFLFHLRSQVKKRRRIFQSPVSGIYRRNLVVEHFFRKKKKFSELDPSVFTK
jgi:GT2 family glycosyltransferase